MNASNKLFSVPSSEERRSSHCLSPFIQISGIMIILALCASLIFSFLVVKRHKDTLYLEKVKGRKILLNVFASHATGPLLGDDLLGLNTLIKEAKEMEGFLYAMIVDNRNIIKADTDPAKIGLGFKAFENAQLVTGAEDIVQVAYVLPSGTRVLDLSRPVMYSNKILGSVHLGVSIDSVNEAIQKESFSFVREIFFLNLLLLVLGIGVAFFINLRFRRYALAPTLTGQERENGQPHLKRSLIRRISDRVIKPRKMEEKPPTIARNQVTVLFAGIKGFKGYANVKDPEEVLKDLNEYLSIAAKWISEYGGYLDRFVGDAVIGVFGNLPLQMDHSERAVRSAMAMQQAFEKATRNGNSLLSLVGIGISTGVVLSGPIGSCGNEGIAFIGESFKVAYLLNVMAGPGEVVLSKDVYQLIEPFVSAEPLPPREMMHRTESWENFRLQSIVDRKDHV
jgi:adenylate cyclase